MQREIEKPGRISDDVGPYENQRTVFACLATVYPWITSVCEFKRSYKSIVIPCQHFASESHRKATKRGEKGKERSVVLFHFLFGSLPTCSRPVTSRWGFQLRYHHENNISRILKKCIECIVQRMSKWSATCIRFLRQPKAQSKVQFSFLFKCTNLEKLSSR